MWFGDNVTCATWQDIWINEGFATYSDYLANEKIHGWYAAQGFIKNAQNSAMSQPGGSIYIPDDEIYQGNEWRIFNGRLSYNKGAAILHILRHEFQNDSLFFAGIQAYQAQYGGGTATGEDFKHAMEPFYGGSLDWFFDEWYYGEGYPKYNFVWFYDGTSKEFHLTSVQTTSASTPLFKMLLDVKLNFADGTDTLVRFMQTSNEDFFVSHQEKTVTNIEIDPENWTMEKVNGITTGTPELENNPANFILGPNPVSDLVTVYLNNNNHLIYITVTDLTGRILKRQQTLSSSVKIDLHSLKQGTYLIMVSDGTNQVVKKLIKL
jgi:aminopeptidase N